MTIDIMKLKNIFNTLSIAAVALIATACNDTDAQYSIPDVDAPQFVTAELADEKPVFFGETTIKVIFDKNIGFASKNTQQITINGSPVSKAIVYGADSVLTITADVDFANSLALHIPAGLILNAQHKAYNQDIDLVFNTEAMPSNTATAFTQQLGWGWNMGNHYDTSNTQWGYWDGATPTAALFQNLAAYGAKTVRIPATWTNHMDDSYTISAEYLDEVATTVDQALAAGLNVILNTHHDSFETDLGNAATNEEAYLTDSTVIVKLWQQVATKFADRSDKLIFETFNEIHAGDNWGGGTAAEYELLNKWNQWVVDVIRASGGNNATRWIGIPGYAANIDLTIDHMVLPTDPANKLAVAVHCYDPYNFCLAPESSGTDSWGHNANPLSSVSGANEEYVISQLYKLRTAYIKQNIPCYLGEYGCVWQTTESANAFRKYYLEFFCRAAYLAGIPMFVWDNTGKDISTAGDEANYYIDHNDGHYVIDGADIVPMMIKACTSTDTSYWFDTIWNHSPAPAN
ncbi:MAG: glycoside hydrolase family 5 protein [Prevotella sp.]|nr:glycoside hydrolase family 5 protein [Prevotella sp.]